VLWCSAGFRFVTLSDAFTTGSSIMPQKRNPDAAELIRGKTGRVIGALTSLLVVMKGLPLSYGKDMQEDKEPLFDAAETLELCVAAMTGMVADMKANHVALKAATAQGFLTATDLADWLVRVLGMPFRQAHHVTGSIVKLAEERGCGLTELPLSAMQAVEPRITEDIFSVLSVQNAVASRLSDGGTAPERVREAVAAAKERFL
jgi:argininosuccinate lyase